MVGSLSAESPLLAIVLIALPLVLVGLLGLPVKASYIQPVVLWQGQP